MRRPSGRRCSGFLSEPGREFDHQLARDLGMRVEVLRAEMSAAEWRDWMTYYKRQRQREELEEMKAKAKAKAK